MPKIETWSYESSFSGGFFISAREEGYVFWSPCIFDVLFYFDMLTLSVAYFDVIVCSTFLMECAVTRKIFKIEVKKLYCIILFWYVNP